MADTVVVGSVRGVVSSPVRLLLRHLLSLGGGMTVSDGEVLERDVY